ncbi:MAG: DUF560 domain-containing protein [Gammaproteobacteria bacterium]|nr:DUF560 domain-containing protein [Gammaproteobacteria bacterium]
MSRRGDNMVTRLQRFALILFLYLVMAPLQAAQPDIAKARALIEAGKAADALALLEPFELEMAGDMEYDYLLASAALNSDQPSRASFIYERILAMYPDFYGVRADMGRAYFMLGDYTRAKIEFETVLRIPDLPLTLKAAVEQYVAAIDEATVIGRPTTVITGYLEIGLGHDRNANSATTTNPVVLADGTLFTLERASLRRADDYGILRAGGEINHMLTDSTAVYLGATLLGRYHNHLDTIDETTLDTRFGLSRSFGNYLLKGGVVAGTYDLDNRLTRDNLGANIDWRYALDAGHQLSAGASAIRYFYRSDDLVSEEYDLLSGNFGWFGALSQTTGLQATVQVGKEDSRRDRQDGDMDFVGLRLTLQTSLTKKVGAFVSLGAQDGEYQRYNDIFGVYRQDKLYDATLGFSWSFAKHWSLRPQLAYTHNDSNIALYEYKKTDLSLNLRRDF